MIPLSNITDIWQSKNPQVIQFNFMKKQTNNFTRSRLDYFLLNDNSTDMVKKVGIGIVCSLSDHRPIYLHLTLSKLQKGRFFLEIKW